MSIESASSKAEASASTSPGPVSQPVPPQYQAGFAKVRDVSPNNYFTLEQLVGLHPDFLFAGWNYGLQAGTNLTPTYLEKFGIKTLVLTESCAHVQPGKDSISINDTYQDLRNLGNIFGVQGRAAAVVAGEARLVAKAVSAVVTVVDPELVVLGGGIGQAPGFAAAVTAELRALAPVLPEVRVSALGTDAVVDGCLASGTELAWARLIRLTAYAG